MRRLARFAPLLLLAAPLLALPLLLGAQAPAAAPKIEDVAAATAINATSINYVWVLLCGLLVMFMQARLRDGRTGFTRASSASHTITMN